MWTLTHQWHHANLFASCLCQSTASKAFYMIHTQTFILLIDDVYCITFPEIIANVSFAFSNLTSTFSISYHRLAQTANAPPAPMMQARASERVRSRATAFLPTRTSYRLSVRTRGRHHGQLYALWREGRGDPCFVVEKVEFVHGCFPLCFVNRSPGARVARPKGEA